MDVERWLSCDVFCGVLFCRVSHCPSVLPSVHCVHLVVLQAEKVLLFSQDTNITALLLEAKDLEARVIILSARFVWFP